MILSYSWLEPGSIPYVKLTWMRLESRVAMRSWTPGPQAQRGEGRGHLAKFLQETSEHPFYIQHPIHPPNLAKAKKPVKDSQRYVHGAMESMLVFKITTLKDLARHSKATTPEIPLEVEQIKD